ncbi:hypothetical protein ANO11243_072690 [Dothideomycetidae sp. 11243]|nr:hypothetical protein ANO11243_072690 [fungal sp. No.11243]
MPAQGMRAGPRRQAKCAIVQPESVAVMYRARDARLADCWEEEFVRRVLFTVEAL